MTKVKAAISGVADTGAGWTAACVQDGELHLVRSIEQLDVRWNGDCCQAILLVM